MADDLVLLVTCPLPSEAEIVVSLLEGEGIDALIDRPFVSGVRPDWLFGRKRPDDGVRILVRREDEERAREILSAKPETFDDESS